MIAAPDTSALKAGRFWAVFGLDQRWFAVPVAAVLRVAPRVAVTALVDMPAALEGVVQFGGHSLPVMDLRQRLGFAPVPPQLSDRLLILEFAEFRVGFHVTALGGVVELGQPGILADRDHGLTEAALSQGIIGALDGTVLALDVAALWSGAPWGAGAGTNYGGRSAV